MTLINITKQSDNSSNSDKSLPTSELTEDQKEQLAIFRKLSDRLGLHPIKYDTKHPKDSGWEQFCVHKKIFKEQDYIYALPNGRQTILNAGIACGPANGIIVLDIDDQEGFELYCSENNIELPLQETLTIASGGKSLHFYFQYPDDGKEYGKRNMGSFDVLGIGAQVIAPGSIHNKTGIAYTIRKDIPIASAPAWILALALNAEEEADNKKTGQKSKRTNSNPMSTESDLIQEGQRDATLTKLAGKMRAAGFTYESILAALQNENLSRCQPPMDDTEVKKIVNSISKYPAGNSGQFLLTELGNAERLISVFGKDLRYCPAEKRWFVWKGNRWEKRTSNSIIDLAKKTIRGIYYEAVKLQDLDEKKKMLSHGLKSESNFGLKAMVELASSDPNIWISPDEFDADPFKLNAQNGTLDLRTGVLYPHKREDLLRAMIPVEYDPHAQCQQFQRFVYSIMNSNMVMVNYLQKIVGYSLTGDTSEQCYFILYGTGSNGKTTLLNVLRALMGPHAKGMGFNSLTYSGDQARTDLARLVGTRVVTCAEINPKKVINESVINRITGGDSVTVRFMYGDEFEYFPVYKLFIAGNDKPNIEGLNYGTWRRIRLIPFEVRFDETTGRINNLEKKLLQELPGILNWAIEGCLNWQRDRLEPPQPVKQATDSYKIETDVFKLFLDDACTINQKEVISSPELYQLFVQWCNVEGYLPIGKVKFSNRLKETGFQKEKKSGQEKWFGIGKRKETDSESQEALAPELFEEENEYPNLL